MYGNLNFVVVSNKNDFWFARICISSIRFFYPTNDIYLLPDFGNGFFSTKELELKFKVKVLDYGVKKFGWGVAKFFPIFDEYFRDRRVLMLDADIILLGTIDKNLTDNEIAKKSREFVVSGEECKDPNVQWVKDIYFDIDAVKELNPKFDYPGYFFNSGCFFYTGGTIMERDFELVFNKDLYPFVLRPDILPFPDQSILNFIIPLLEKEKKIQVKHDFPFMIWSQDSERMRGLNIEDLRNDNYENLIHWAGDLRTPFLSKMRGSDILYFFEDYYYSKIRFGTIIRVLRRYQFTLNNLLTRVLSKLKS